MEDSNISARTRTVFLDNTNTTGLTLSTVFSRDGLSTRSNKRDALPKNASGVKCTTLDTGLIYA